MAGRHSLTVQIDPSLPGHLAIVLGDPSGQTYAGFGPKHHGRPYDEGRFNVHTMESGEAPPPDYSNAMRPRTFTFPISEDQAKAAHQEIERVQREKPLYDARLGLSNPQVCSTIASRIMKAAGLGDHLYTVPQVDLEYLSDIADTLANNPKARLSAKIGLPIPDEFRGIQPDYAKVGAGYDTPSERLGHVPLAPGNSSPDVAPSFDARFGRWPSLPDGAMKPETGQPATDLAASPVRYLGRMGGASGASVFDTGASPAPFVPAASRPSSPAPPATFADRFVGTAPTDRAEHANTPPGLVSGQPMPDYPMPPFLFGLPDRSAASGDDADDWYTRWVKPLLRS